MTTKNFNVKKGLTAGNVKLDANTGNILASNVNASSLITTVDLKVTGNLTSNLTPSANGVLSLGNTTSRYKDIFLSNVVYVAEQQISANVTTVTISGNISTGDISAGNITITGNVNANVITANTAFVANANANVIYANVGNIKLFAANVITANTGNISNINAVNIEANTINVANITATKIVVDLVEGNVFRANSANIKAIISDYITVNNQIIINSTTQATSTTTGSFVTAGGVGIAKDLFVGGSIHLANGNGGTTSKGIINYNDGVESIDFNFNNS